MARQQSSDKDGAGKSRREYRPQRPRKPGWKPIFLAELEKWGVVDHAIRTAGVASSTAYEAKEKDPEFARAWVEAEKKIVATAEVVCRQRAVLGTSRPVYFQGKKVDSIVEVDNAHLRWLLSKLKPDVYGDKIELNQNVKGALDLNVSGTVDVTLYSDEQLASLDTILSKPDHAPLASTNGTGTKEPSPVR